MIRRKRASARRRAAGGSRGFGRCRGLGGLLGLRFALLARDRTGRIVALLALHHPRLVEKAQHPVGRQRALGSPRAGLPPAGFWAVSPALRGGGGEETGRRWTRHGASAPRPC